MCTLSQNCHGVALGHFAHAYGALPKKHSPARIGNGSPKPSRTKTHVILIKSRSHRKRQQCLCGIGNRRDNDSLAEWSKALASGASPQGRGFEPHSCHFHMHSPHPQHRTRVFCVPTHMCLQQTYGGVRWPMYTHLWATSNKSHHPPPSPKKNERVVVFPQDFLKIPKTDLLPPVARRRRPPPRDMSVLGWC